MSPRITNSLPRSSAQAPPDPEAPSLPSPARDKIRSRTVYRGEWPLAETQREFGRVKPKRHDVVEKHTPQQDLVDAAAGEREPRLFEDVMEDEGLCSVGIAATKRFGIDQLETREGRVWSKPVREDHEILRPSF